MYIFLEYVFFFVVLIFLEIGKEFVYGEVMDVFFEEVVLELVLEVFE